MKIFTVLRKDLLILLRSRAEMAVLFLVPLAFSLPVSLALGSGDGYGIQRERGMIPLVVVDYDGGPYAQLLQGAIGESLKLEKDFEYRHIEMFGLTKDEDCAEMGPLTEADNLPEAENQPAGEAKIIAITPACGEKIARKMVENSIRTAALIIPKNFSSDIARGQPAQAALVYDPAGDSTRFQQIEGVVSGAAMRISVEHQVKQGMSQLIALAAFAPEDVRRSIEQSQAGETEGEEENPAIRLQKSQPGSYRQKQAPDTYQQTIPGYTVMFVFFIITAMSTSFHQEKLNGTFRRLLSAPVGRAELVGGKLLSAILVGMAQVLLLFGAGALLFKLDLGSDPAAFLLLTLALVSAAASIGLAAATTQFSSGLLVIPLVISALLGGCMFPLDLFPGFLRKLSYLVPHSWALTGYQNLMVRGLGIEEVLPQAAVLFGFAAVFFLIAVRRLKSDL